MTQAITNANTDPITHEDYARIMQPAQQAQAGENPELATLQRASSSAAIGLMGDAMLADDEATTALWSDLEQDPDGSGRLTISHAVAMSRKQRWTHSPPWRPPSGTWEQQRRRTTPYFQQTARRSSSSSATHVHPQASTELTAQTRPRPA